MRHYEILLMIHPDQGGQINAMIGRYAAIVTKSGGKVHRQEDWGKLQLAYQINKLHKANYVLLNIECDQAILDELNNAFKFNDAIIRSMITKCDAAITEQSAFFKNKDNEKSNKDGSHYYASQSGSGYYNNSKEYEAKSERGYDLGDSSVNDVIDG